MPQDNLYWSPLELETDESLQVSKPHIDPWDLENYVYIRDHLDYLELNLTHSRSNGSCREFGEAFSNSSHYIAGKKFSLYILLSLILTLKHL